LESSLCWYDELIRFQTGRSALTCSQSTVLVVPVATREPRGVLVIDAANVIGSRPTGWWRDRAGAARQFVQQLRDAAKHGRLPLPAAVVLEGSARAGISEADVDGVRVVHATHSGDDALVEQTAAATAGVICVTADRRLLQRVRELGAETVSPSWLNDRLRSHGE
jgi:hypothetical protein